MAVLFSPLFFTRIMIQCNSLTQVITLHTTKHSYWHSYVLFFSQPKFHFLCINCQSQVNCSKQPLSVIWDNSQSEQQHCTFMLGLCNVQCTAQDRLEGNCIVSWKCHAQENREGTTNCIRHGNGFFAFTEQCLLQPAWTPLLNELNLKYTSVKLTNTASMHISKYQYWYSISNCMVSHPINCKLHGQTYLHNSHIKKCITLL